MVQQYYIPNRLSPITNQHSCITRSDPVVNKTKMGNIVAEDSNNCLISNILYLGVPKVVRCKCNQLQAKINKYAIMILKLLIADKTTVSLK